MTIKEYIEKIRRKHPECDSIIVEEFFKEKRQGLFTLISSKEYKYSFEEFEKTYNLDTKMNRNTEMIRGTSIIFTVLRLER